MIFSAPWRDVLLEDDELVCKEATKMDVRVASRACFAVTKQRVSTKQMCCDGDSGEEHGSKKKIKSMDRHGKRDGREVMVDAAMAALRGGKGTNLHFRKWSEALMVFILLMLIVFSVASLIGECRAVPNEELTEG